MRRLLIDADSQNKLLVKALRESGHDVLTANEAHLRNALDPEIFAYAIQDNRIILTRNCKDFELLHQQNYLHPGIFACYQYADTSKNMSRRDIVKAIDNIESAKVSVENQFISLNCWNY